MILEYGTSSDRGVVFGIFWAFYRIASISGGVLSYTYFSLNPSGGGAGLYIIFLVLVLAGSAGTALLKNPAYINGREGDADGGELLGTLDQSKSWFNEVASTFRMFLSQPIMLLSALFWTSGGIEPYILSGFTSRFFQKRTTGMEVACFFSLSVIGSLVTGRILDQYSAEGRERRGGSLLLAIFSCVHFGAFACAAIVEVGTAWNQEYSLSDGLVILPSVAFVLFGLSDAMINTFLYWLIGVLYQDGPSRSYAIGCFKFLNSAAHVVGYAILPSSAKVQLWYNVVLYGIGVLMAFLVTSKVDALKKVPIGTA